MRYIFRNLIKLPAINRAGRWLIREGDRQSRRLVRALRDRVHVSGVVVVSVGGHPLSLFARGDDALTTKLYYGVEWERGVCEWFSLFARHHSFIVDAGANIGVFSLIAACANSKCTVYSFEPHPSNFSRLVRNIEINGFQQRIHPVQCALGDSEGETTLYVPSDDRISDVASIYRSHAESFSDKEYKAVVVPVTDLGSFCEKAGVMPGLIKIDVELFEYQVIQGIRPLLQNPPSMRPILFCEIFNDVLKRRLNPTLDADLPRDYTKRVRDLLRELDYHVYAFLEEGIAWVPDLTCHYHSTMFLILPCRLSRQFYTTGESALVFKELSGA